MRKTKDQYANDLERLKSRVDLVMGSFEGAHGVDQELLQFAKRDFCAGFAMLKMAMELPLE